VECRESLASVQEFRRANEIINMVKRADGQNLHIFDVLDATHTSQWWWKDHKKWFFHRHFFMEMQKIEGEDYLCYIKDNNNNNNKLKNKIFKNKTLSTPPTPQNEVLD